MELLLMHLSKIKKNPQKDIKTFFFSEKSLLYVNVAF